ncbi:LysR family transcriptional regulator [Roseivivax isoporae]|uniref:LysR family transcriptional regulator n=1 Tax=Roseivivax isoporae LMG 25204 TaxID=1449351 RepID=X7F9Y8_9RHOB|nr:LysR family transcriptional regulator [Roseivivax isoporae]ETX29727.1 LysR family transcriptional regulator [Roseivivax isoporae LMG 25204]
MDKLSVMHAFRRIVERGSFARAAEDLGVSPALLSREIKLLEESLGTTLLTRTTRSMSLTDAGRLYYDEATGILDAVTQVETRIRDGAGAVQGHLKVNASSSFGQTVIAPILPGFLDAYPDLRLTLSMDDRVVDMVEGGFDVSIRIRPAMPDSALVARKVGTMRQRIFASPAYLDRAGVPVVPQDIARYRVVGFLLADHLTSWALTGPSGTITIDLDPPVRVGNSLVLRDLLIAGQGIGTLPDFLLIGTSTPFLRTTAATLATLRTEVLAFGNLATTLSPIGKYPRSGSTRISFIGEPMVRLGSRPCILVAAANFLGGVLRRRPAERLDEPVVTCAQRVDVVNVVAACRDAGAWIAAHDKVLHAARRCEILVSIASRV